MKIRENGLATVRSNLNANYSISVSRYIKICLQKDWVYAPNGQGQVTISPEGEEAYNNRNCML
jgi:hypothetical protein